MNYIHISLIVLLCVCSILIFNNYYKSKESFSNQESFIESKYINGAKEGYVLKNDSKGLGYYQDKQLV